MWSRRVSKIVVPIETQLEDIEVVAKRGCVQTPSLGSWTSHGWLVEIHHPITSLQWTRLCRGQMIAHSRVQSARLVGVSLEQIKLDWLVVQLETHTLRSDGGTQNNILLTSRRASEG